MINITIIEGTSFLRCYNNSMNNKVNHAMVSFLQFVFSILVIMFHSSRLFHNDITHFIQRSLFSRMAVPFFIICSSFYVKKKIAQESTYLTAYIKNYIKNYLIWSLVFLPYGIYYFISLSLPVYLFPATLMLAILYTGTCYHLWYLPAFLTGLFLVNLLRKRVALPYVFLIFFVLYCIGSIETYSAFFENTIVMSTYSSYATIFFTSRNGLFYSPVFICLGFIVYEYRENDLFIHYYSEKLLLSFLLLCLETYIVYKNQGLDKNFLLALVPFSMFLFNWAIRVPFYKNKSFYKLKQLSILYFFIHPLFIELINMSPLKELMNTVHLGWATFSITLIGTHLLASLILYIIKHKTLKLQ